MRISFTSIIQWTSKISSMVTIWWHVMTVSCVNDCTPQSTPPLKKYWWLLRRLKMSPRIWGDLPEVSGISFTNPYYGKNLQNVTSYLGRPLKKSPRIWGDLSKGHIRSEVTFSKGRLRLLLKSSRLFQWWSTHTCNDLCCRYEPFLHTWYSNSPFFIVHILLSSLASWIVCRQDATLYSGICDRGRI